MFYDRWGRDQEAGRGAPPLTAPQGQRATPPRIRLLAYGPNCPVIPIHTIVMPITVQMVALAVHLLVQT